MYECAYESVRELANLIYVSVLCWYFWRKQPINKNLERDVWRKNNVFNDKSANVDIGGLHIHPPQVTEPVYDRIYTELYISAL